MPEARSGCESVETVGLVALGSGCEGALKQYIYKTIYVDNI